MDCFLVRRGAMDFNPPTIIDDTFNRSNGNLGTADSGQNWLTGGSNTTAWVVSSNVAKRASATTSVNDVTYIDCGKSDVVISADITITSFSSGSRLIARMSGTNINNSMYMMISAAGIVSITRAINGSGVTLAQAPYSYSYGSTYACKFICRGNIFSAYIDGVLKVSTEDDNTLKSNTLVGMFLPCSSTSSDYFDNFIAKG